MRPPVTAVAWMALAALTVVAVAMVRRYPWPAFGWLFFLLALSVESSFLLLELAFEHRMYLPASLLIAGLVAPLYVAASHRARLHQLQVPVLLVAALLSWQTIERNYQWLDLGRFWADDMDRGASPDRAAINSASSYLRKGYPDKALTILERGEDAATPSTRYKLLQARGEAYYAKGEYERALEVFRQVLELNPAWTRTAYFAGQSLLQLGNVAGARNIEAQMQQAQPGNAFTAALSAEIARASGNPDRAVSRLETYLAGRRRAGGHEASFARLHLANAYRATGQYDEAADVYRQVVRYDPHNWAAWSNLYLMLEAGDSKQEAAEVRRFLEARDVNPGHWR
jgi:tetratricopeptide (TPR) repeat protein